MYVCMYVYVEEDILGLPVKPRVSGWDDDNFLFPLTLDQPESQKLSQLSLNSCLFYYDFHKMYCCQEGPVSVAGERKSPPPLWNQRNFNKLRCLRSIWE